MSQRITIDPVTRIEGHLRIDCEIENGVVSKAWASGTMWRGMEEIVKNRDPRDAWMIVQHHWHGYSKISVNMVEMQRKYLFRGILQVAILQLC